MILIQDNVDISEVVRYNRYNPMTSEFYLIISQNAREYPTIFEKAKIKRIAKKCSLIF